MEGKKVEGKKVESRIAADATASNGLAPSSLPAEQAKSTIMPTQSAITPAQPANPTAPATGTSAALPTHAKALSAVQSLSRATAQQATAAHAGLALPPIMAPPNTALPQPSTITSSLAPTPITAIQPSAAPTASRQLAAAASTHPASQSVFSTASLSTTESGEAPIGAAAYMGDVSIPDVGPPALPPQPSEIATDLPRYLSVTRHTVESLDKRYLLAACSLFGIEDVDKATNARTVKTKLTATMNAFKLCGKADHCVIDLATHKAMWTVPTAQSLINKQAAKRSAAEAAATDENMMEDEKDLLDEVCSLRATTLTL